MGCCCCCCCKKGKSTENISAENTAENMIENTIDGALDKAVNANAETVDKANDAVMTSAQKAVDLVDNNPLSKTKFNVHELARFARMNPAQLQAEAIMKGVDYALDPKKAARDLRDLKEAAEDAEAMLAGRDPPKRMEPVQREICENQADNVATTAYQQAIVDGKSIKEAWEIYGLAWAEELDRVAKEYEAGNAKIAEEQKAHEDIYGNLDAMTIQIIDDMGKNMGLQEYQRVKASGGTEEDAKKAQEEMEKKTIKEGAAKFQAQMGGGGAAGAGAPGAGGSDPQQMMAMMAAMG